MNEVTTIHLGRQAFTISVEAFAELRHYLDDIKKHVHDSEVVEEVEMRMAELLVEHGVSGEKVILPADVDFLQAQLGNPKDFDENTDESKVDATNEAAHDGKRLFRDAEHGMFAGVAAGLAQYFGLDIWLVRVLFIIGTITGGWAVVIYIVIWILVPEAKTPSEQLQMAGKPVNIDGLKEMVNRADVKGAANRVSKSLVTSVNMVFSIILKTIGVAFIVAALSALIGLVALASYAVLHGGNAVAQGNIFPVGSREYALLYLSIGIVSLMMVFGILIGLAIFRRKWPIRAWITGVLVGILFLGMSIGGALAADVVPTVHDRYEANMHTTTRSTAKFEKIQTIGDIDVDYELATTYGVKFHYYGQPNLSTIKTTVTNNVLTVDTQHFNNQRNCERLCIPNSFVLRVTIETPNIPTPDKPIPAPTPIDLPPKP